MFRRRWVWALVIRRSARDPFAITGRCWSRAGSLRRLAAFAARRRRDAITMGDSALAEALEVAEIKLAERGATGGNIVATGTHPTVTIEMSTKFFRYGWLGNR